MVIIGDLAALACAMFWAGASNLFSVAVKVYTPMQLNFVKGAISSLILFFIMYFFHDTLLPEAETSLYMYLIASGISGIAIGDTLYFQALEVLGPKTTILMKTLAPPFTGLLAFFYYGDTISFMGWAGIMLVIGGITIVIKENKQEQDQPTQDVESLTTQVDIPLLTQQEITKKQGQGNKAKVDSQANESSNVLSNKKIKGVISGVFSMLFHALGIILSHDSLRTKAFDPITSTCLRLSTGSLFVAIIMCFKKSETFKFPSQTKKENAILGLGILFGPILCIGFQQMSLIYTRPEIAQTLMGTTPLFAICISVGQGQKVSQRYIIGCVLALIGVVFIVWKG